MLQFFKNIFAKKEVRYLDSLSEIVVDMHSHLIPKIDDGSKSNEESQQIIQELTRYGFKKIITTPHIMKGGYDNTLANITTGKDALNAFLKENNSPTIQASAEYFGDEHFLALIKNKDILPVYNNYVLFEQSFMQKSVQLQDIIFELQIENYKPILAHPERYSYFIEKDLTTYKELKSKGIFFQLNLFSLLGVYGELAKQTAEKMIEAQLIDFVGTDIHNATQLQYLEPLLYNKHLAQLIAQQKLLNQTLL